MKAYAEFLAQKQATSQTAGTACSPADVHSLLHDWQRLEAESAVPTLFGDGAS